MKQPSQPVTLYRMSMPEHECPWGLKAAALLTEKGIPFTDIKLTSQAQVDAFRAQYQVATTPQLFFGAERIGGYTDLAAYLGVAAEKADYSYLPVIAVFGVAALMSLALSLGVMGFMGVALCLLAMLKLMDLQSFVKSFKQYDLITQHFAAYGWAFPFIELGLGLALLAHQGLTLASIIAILLGISGSISVYKAVYVDKLALNCACVGGNTKAPLGVVSMAENLTMLAMGIMLLLKL